MDRYYSGIGSRQTPFDIQLLMFDIAAFLGKKYILRSGGADGADLAFENGNNNVSSNHKPEIFLAKDCTEEALEYSSKFHPTWHKCSPFAKKLHGRNAMILLGKNLDEPSERVIGYCIEKNGKWEGGTGQGFRIAKANNIKIYNLYFEEVRKKFIDLIYWGRK